MHKKCQHSANSPNNVSSSQAKKSITEFQKLFTSTVLSFVQNRDTSLNLALESRATGKVINFAHKFIGKCNNRQRCYLNDSPDMNKIMLFMQSNGIHILFIKFDSNKKLITISKEPRFMTETTINNRNELMKKIFNLNTNVTHCDVSDESDDQSTGTTDTGTTDTGTTVTYIIDMGTTYTTYTYSTYTGTTDTGATYTGNTDTGTSNSSTKYTGTTHTGTTDTRLHNTGITDTSTKDTGTTYTGTTYTGTTDTGEITQVFHTCDTIEDTLYQLGNNAIDNIKSLIMTVNTTTDDVWLNKFARKCKFLVTLESFLRESGKVKMNLLTENGFLVATTFSNDVLKNFNAGTQCSFTKNALLSNLFQRIRTYDYCILRTEYQPRKVIIIKKMKNVKK